MRNFGCGTSRFAEEFRYWLESKKNSAKENLGENPAKNLVNEKSKKVAKKLKN